MLLRCHGRIRQLLLLLLSMAPGCEGMGCSLWMVRTECAHGCLRWRIIITCFIIVILICIAFILRILCRHLIAEAITCLIHVLVLLGVRLSVTTTGATEDSGRHRGAR